MNKIFKIAIPVSNLFKDRELERKIIAHSDVLELRDHKIDIGKEYSFIYHSELNILAKWDYREIKKLERINKNYPINLVSYHLKSRYQKNIIQNNIYIGLGKPFSISEMKGNIRDNIRISRQIFGYYTPILVENINYLLTDAYEIISDSEFIRDIIEENDIYLLLDIPHAAITAFNRKISFKEYLTKLPLDRCKQVHISGYSYNNGIAVDSHEVLQKDDWTTFKELLNLMGSVEYVTIEYYKDGDKLLQQLKKLKKIQEEFLLNDMLQHTEWDTAFFGFKVAKLECSDLNKELLKKCIERAREKKIMCIYCLSDPENEVILKSVGFKKFDEKIEYIFNIQEDEPFENIKIEEVKSEDIPKIKKIASKAFRGMTRFYRDPHFDPKKIDILYEKWVENLVNDKDSTILIIKENDNIAAFNGISIKNGDGRIELIAVDEHYKNKGYGKLLIKQAYKFFNKINLEKKNINIEGRRIYLRPLTENDVSEKYSSWLNDPEVTKYVDSKKATIEDLKEYVKVKYNDPNCLFLGIFLKNNDIHIGNVKLEPINFKERTARAGLLMGEKQYWNQGYETETYTILENYAFKNLKLMEIDAGLYKEDLTAIKNLENSGFSIYDEDENIYKMRIKVATQNINIPAKNLYTKMGFINKEKKYWFHWWNEEKLNGKTSN